MFILRVWPKSKQIGKITKLGPDLYIFVKGLGLVSDRMSGFVEQRFFFSSFFFIFIFIFFDAYRIVRFESNGEKYKNMNKVCFVTESKRGMFLQAPHQAP